MIMQITERLPASSTNSYFLRRPAFRPQCLEVNDPVCMQSLNCDRQCWTQFLICLPLQLRMQSDLA